MNAVSASASSASIRSASSRRARPPARPSVAPWTAPADDGRRETRAPATPPPRLDRAGSGSSPASPGGGNGRGEVVREELRELADALAGGPLEPASDGSVRGRSVAAGERLVGDVAGQHVLEEELGLPGRGSTRRERTRARGPPAVGARRRRPTAVDGGQLGDRTGPEDAPDDGGRLEDALVAGVEEIDPGREHGLDRVGDLARCRSPAPRASGRPRGTMAPSSISCG